MTWVLVIFSLFASAQDKAAKTQIAVVQGDGASVYESPSFDAKVLMQLRAGQKVRVSLQMSQGDGGFGTFYRVHFKNNRFGFISDVELLPEYTEVGKRKRIQANPEFAAYEDNQNARDPIFFTRYIGVNLGMASFTEKFSGTKLFTPTVLYGLKLTGPGVLFSGPPIDFNFLFHLGAPKYYSQVAQSNATGYFLITDALLMFPLLEGRRHLLSFGFGPLVVYAAFKMTINTAQGPALFDSQEVRVGASSTLSYTYRLNKYAVRADAKYYLEKTQYPGFNLSVMTEY